MYVDKAKHTTYKMINQMTLTPLSFSLQNKYPIYMTPSFPPHHFALPKTLRPPPHHSFLSLQSAKTTHKIWTLTLTEIPWDFPHQTGSQRWHSVILLEQTILSDENTPNFPQTAQKVRGQCCHSSLRIAMPSSTQKGGWSDENESGYLIRSHEHGGQIGHSKFTALLCNIVVC